MYRKPAEFPARQGPAAASGCGLKRRSRAVFLLVFSVTFAALVLGGCNGNEEEGQADSGDGGVGGEEIGGGNDRGMDASSASPSDNSGNYVAPCGPCGCPIGVDTYTDGGVNSYIAERYGAAPYPTHLFMVYCFTRGVDCEGYTVDLRLRLESVTLTTAWSGTLRHIGLPGTRFFFPDDEWLNADDYSGMVWEPGAKMEIARASLFYQYQPCGEGTGEIPYLDMEGSVDMVTFVRDEQDALPEYVILRNEEGNIVFEKSGFCESFAVCEYAEDDAGV